VKSLDEIIRDLASVQDALITVDESDSTRLGELRLRQTALREEARAYSDDLVDTRSTVQIRAELRAHQAKRDGLAKHRIDLIKQSSSGSGMATDAIPEATLNRKLMSAHDVAGIESRIAHLRQLLEKRGESA
jgi:hypothetical protein